MNQPTDEIKEYLKNHRHCVLATGRRDGSPQQALVTYQYDGSDILLSSDASAAKVANARRVPQVSLVVLDGRNELIVYGTARVVSDPAEMEALQARFGPRPVPPPREPAPGEPPPQPRPSRSTGPRVQILVTPTRFIDDRMVG
jgi:PPOX class probable F420-dependent enzyme